MKQGHYIIIEKIFNEYFKQHKNLKQDLIQEGFFAIQKCQKKYNKSKGSFSTYVKKPIFNAMLKFVNKENKHASVSLDEKSFENSEKQTYADIIQDNNNVIDMVELSITIDFIIRHFSKKQQKIILKFIYGYSQAEISEDLKLSKQTVNYTIKRFRDELKLVIKN